MFANRLVSLVRILDLMLITAMSLSMFMLKTKTLPIVFMNQKMRQTWALVIKVSCLVMPLMNGMTPYYTHTHMCLPINSVRKWQSRERMDLSHG